jgi:hypothetical protein
MSGDPRTPLDFSRLAATHAADPSPFAAHMAAREAALRSIFGEPEPPDRILTPADPNLALNWPGGGVYAFPPRKGRTAWHYVTHGLSQPHEFETQPTAENVSGFGIELVISTPAAGHWAPDILFNFVAMLLFDESPPNLLPLHRVSGSGPLVVDTDTPLQHILCLTSGDYPSLVRLPGGLFELVHLTGITDGELQRARAWGPGEGGSMILQHVLDELGVGALTDPNRRSLTEADGFEAVWRTTEAALEAEWRQAGWTGQGKA